MEQQSSRSWLGAVFGLLFVVAGLFAAYSSAGEVIVGYVASGDWIEVPATIENVRLVSHRGESITYSVESAYAYTFEGVTYRNDRVSLSSGADNLGTYWQDLARALRLSQRNNSALAFVDPDNPSNALLDRTWRWRSMVFGSMFLLLFCAAGGFMMWASLREPKSRETRLLLENNLGISSDQKTGSWLLAGFGGVFFVMGAGFSLLILPDAIRKGEYAALLLLLFVLVGVATMYYAFTLHRSYRRFGPTPLFLDPSVPGVGGQLGGRFSINSPILNHTSFSNTQMQASLTCIRKRKSGKTTHRRIEWQDKVPVYLQQTSSGYEATFVFDIPEECLPTKMWSRGSSIKWSVTVEAESSDSAIGKFERSWMVVVDSSAAKSNTVLVIPNSFDQKAKRDIDDRVTMSALMQVPVTEDERHIDVLSRAGRNIVSKLVMLLVGGIFSCIGVYTTMQNWWPGYLFAAVGGAIVIASVFILGKAIRVKIDKNSRVLYTQENWFGFVYAHRQADITSRDQFTLKKTSSTDNQKKIVQYYSLSVESAGKAVRIADGIKGKKEAQAVKDAIINRLFGQDLSKTVS